MILSIDACSDILDDLVEEYPEELFQGLNGGILLLEDAMPDPEAGDDVYIMGEYCWDELGRYINLTMVPSLPCCAMNRRKSGRMNCALPCAMS